MDHDVMVEEAGHFPRAIKVGTGAEVGLLPLHHLLAQDFPRIGVYREDHKDFKGMKAFVGWVIRIRRGDEGRQADEAATLPLDVSQCRYHLLVQERQAGAEDGTRERDDGGNQWKSGRCGESSRDDPGKAVRWRD